MSNLTKRFATAAVLIPALLCSLFVDPTVWSILVFSALVVVLAGDEYVRMALPTHVDDVAWGLRVAFGTSVTAIVVLATVFGPSLTLAPSVMAAALVMCVVVLVRRGQLAHAGRHMATVLGGLLYLPVLACVWPLLKQEFGPEWLFLALATAFSSDSSAYFVGRAFGRHKLYEAVSPKKTVEGALGGLVGGAAALCGFGMAWLTPELPLVHAIALGVVGSALGQTGDLVESMVKRTFDVKDSGTVLPGHGGMLDRVDALLFVAPLIYWYKVAVG